jgi:hypothetical protein
MRETNIYIRYKAPEEFLIHIEVKLLSNNVLVKRMRIIKLYILIVVRYAVKSSLKTMHNAWIFSPTSLLNISVYRLQPRLFIDSPPYLKKKTNKFKKYLLL